jgi:hypothetical protein
VRWVNLLTPVTAYEILSGLFFASAISSGRLLMPSLGLIPIDIGCTAVIPMNLGMSKLSYTLKRPRRRPKSPLASRTLCRRRRFRKQGSVHRATRPKPIIAFRCAAPVAVPKTGQCPSGFVQSGAYCIEMRRLP